MTDTLLEANGQQIFTWGAGIVSQSGLESAGAARTEYIEALQEADARKFERLIRFVRS